MYYVLDTNIWLDLTRGKVLCADLSNKAHIKVVVAPFVIMELMKETVKHKGKYFENDKSVFQCMAKFDVLALTKVFIYQRLWNSGEEASARVGSENYKKLLQMMVDSGSYDEFIEKTKSAGSEWFQAETWDATHEGVLDKELRAVDQLAKVDPKSIATGLAKLYPFKGSFPKEDSIEREFSAALEYLRSVTVKVRNGANLAKNDRGMYVDFQILFYLADPNATIVSNEHFFSEISKSPQKDRIITLAQFLAL
jgi:predicted nucleic acid-binding protein